jgi:hypothetical protein
MDFFFFFLFNIIFIINLFLYSLKVKSGLNLNNQMNKMYRLETGSSFCLAPMDNELKDFVKQKKEIKEKLHDHWKIELNVKFKLLKY